MASRAGATMAVDAGVRKLKSDMSAVTLHLFAKDQLRGLVGSSGLDQVTCKS